MRVQLEQTPQKSGKPSVRRAEAILLRATLSAGCISGTLGPPGSPAWETGRGPAFAPAGGHLHIALKSEKAMQPFYPRKEQRGLANPTASIFVFVLLITEYL